MKRFVSYLYSIYNNQKIHNAGFARMELRAGRNRLDIHLKENGYAGKTGTVYLFIRNQKNIRGISIGTISFRGNQADFRYEHAEENIGQTSLQIMQMNGILIMVDDRAAFLSQWDEEPVDTSRFEVWDADRHEKPDQTDGNDTDQAGTIKKRNTSRTREEHLESSVTNNSQQPSSSFNRHKTSDRMNGSNSRNQSVNERIPENLPERGEAGTGEAMQDATGIRAEESMQDAAGIAVKKSIQGAAEIAVKKSIQDAAGIIAEESLQVPAGTKGGLLPADANTAFFSEKPVEENYSADLQTGEYASWEEKTMGPAVRNLSSEQSGDIRTAELKPRMTDDWGQIWRTMLRMYPVLNQFGDKDKVLCVRIEIKDVRMLPEKYWSIINNSFLLHGFFNYRYLAFGRIDQRWFIGIPGIYQNQEHIMASAFGFPDFLPQKDKNERGEQPGYWYRILEIPV